MGIRVVHDPSASLIGPAAYTAGLGQYKQRQSEIARDQYNRDRAMAFEAQQSYFNRAFQAQQADRQFALQMREQAAQQQARQQAFLYDALKSRQEMQAYQQKAAIDQQQQQQEFVRKGLNDGTLRYSATQKQKMAKLYSDWDRIQQDQRLRPNDRSRALSEVQRQLGMIQPRPVGIDEQPKPLSELFQQEMFPVPGFPGAFATRGADGKWNLLHADRGSKGAAGKEATPPGQVITDPTTNKPIKFTDQWGNVHNVSKPEKPAPPPKPELTRSQAHTAARQHLNDLLSSLPPGVKPTAEERASMAEILRDYYSALTEPGAEPPPAPNDEDFIPITLRQRIEIEQRRPELLQQYKNEVHRLSSEQESARIELENRTEHASKAYKKQADGKYKWVDEPMSPDEIKAKWPDLYKKVQAVVPEIDRKDLENMSVADLERELRRLGVEPQGGGEQQPPMEFDPTQVPDPGVHNNRLPEQINKVFGGAPAQGQPQQAPVLQPPPKFVSDLLLKPGFISRYKDQGEAAKAAYSANDMIEILNQRGYKTLKDALRGDPQAKAMAEEIISVLQ
jgi:hypothetical protein